MGLPFNRNKGATGTGKASTGKGKPTKARRSKYAEANVELGRDPIPEEGVYRFRVLETEEGFNEGSGQDSFKVKVCAVEVGDDTPAKPGDEFMVVFIVSGKGGPAGVNRAKELVMAAAGFGPTMTDRQGMSTRDLRAAIAEAQEAYDAQDEEWGYRGAFIDALTGVDNGVDGDLEGRLVDCEVGRGNLRWKDPEKTVPAIGANGEQDYYRDYKWSVVPEEEQDA